MDVKEGIGSLKDEDGRDTADVGKMACILNHYFGAIQVNSLNCKVSNWFNPS